MDNAKQEILSIFYEICKVPRKSKQEHQILEMLKAFAEKQSWQWKQDSVGNIVMYVPSEGASKTVCLQSHCDMVCEKVSGSSHDFSTDPIETYEQDGWVYAKGTTLGADNGIGMAISMYAGLAQYEGKPNLELLFTIDEETGMTGARGLDASLITSGYMINLDSDAEGFIIGCAGGERASVEGQLEMETLPSGFNAYSISITGLLGGHSGVDIDTGRANAICIAGEILESASNALEARLVSITGGTVTNAIPRDVTIVLAVEDYSLLQCIVDVEADRIKNQYDLVEKTIKVDIETAEKPENVLSLKQTKAVARLISSLPNGPLGWRADMIGVVELSANVAVVSLEGCEFSIKMSQRSSDDSKLTLLAEQIERVCSDLGFVSSFSSRYPGWEPRVASEIVRVAKKAFVEVAGQEGPVNVIHAGLECGVIGKKLPFMQLISMGPEMQDIHSPKERLNIESVGRCYSILENMLKKLEIPNKAVGIL